MLKINTADHRSQDCLARSGIECLDSRDKIRFPPANQFGLFFRLNISACFLLCLDGPFEHTMRFLQGALCIRFALVGALRFVG